MHKNKPHINDLLIAVEAVIQAKNNPTLTDGQLTRIVKTFYRLCVSYNIADEFSWEFSKDIPSILNRK